MSTGPGVCDVLCTRNVDLADTHSKRARNKVRLKRSTATSTKTSLEDGIRPEAKSVPDSRVGDRAIAGSIPIIEILDSEDENPISDYEMKIDELLAKCRIQADIIKARELGAMNHPGIFFIDHKLVPVDLYQEGLLTSAIEPTAVVSDICLRCGWGAPVFTSTSYVPLKGFRGCLVVNGQEFHSRWTGRSPTAVETMAAAYFLQYLGFKIYNANLNLFHEWTHVDVNAAMEERLRLESEFRRRLDSFEVSAPRLMTKGVPGPPPRVGYSRRTMKEKSINTIYETLRNRITDTMLNTKCKNIGKSQLT